MNKYIIGNWKSNKTVASTQAWLKEFDQALVGNLPEKVAVVVAPAFTQLQTFAQEKQNYSRLSKLHVAVQDVSPFAAGSYTGAVSVENLQDLGVAFAIVGHSERRRYFQETHQDVANKIGQCLDAGVTPVVCVDDEYISEQAAAIGTQDLEKCIVAYEELSSIGTGDNQSPEKVSKMVSSIKNVFGNVSVLYGGSVTPGNVEEYIPVCDGVLVGGASLKAEHFAQIVSTW